MLDQEVISFHNMLGKDMAVNPNKEDLINFLL